LLDFLKEPVLAIQEFFTLTGNAIRNIFRRPHYPDDIFLQMDDIGVGSLPIVVMTGFFSGAVMALQMSRALAQYGQIGRTGMVVAITLVRELGPDLTALMVAGRNTSGIASELGSMKVTEQIDAIQASGVDPFKYLVATRVAACVLMLPLLAIVGDACGIVMGWIANAMAEPITLTRFIELGFRRVDFTDFVPSTLKTMVFGWIIGVIACFQGMRASRGTRGVGIAATSSVVIASLFIILADVILVRLILVLFAR